MKKQQMEVMREARTMALIQGVSFHTMNLRHPDGKKIGGNIIAAIKKLTTDDFEIGEPGRFVLTLSQIRLYRIQFSFCSPHEKNNSRIFGEGQSALRFFNPKSALVMSIQPDEKLSDCLRQAALDYAAMRGVPWLKDVTVRDLV